MYAGTLGVPGVHDAVFDKARLSFEHSSQRRPNHAKEKHGRHTLASLSAAWCASIVGCRCRASILLACGRVDREHDRLGSATRSSCTVDESREDIVNGAVWQFW
jgi:hypothetical protein